jgi:hypothetical protein
VKTNLIYVLICTSLAVPLGAAQAQESLAEPTDIGPISVPREENKVHPRSAEAALKQAGSAYEYGDMPLLVESARLVTDGTVRSDQNQLAEALRFLGIGLYVTGRIEGARTAFEKLLQLRPNTELDPATTRPEIVGFFFDLRRERIRELRHAHEASLPNIMWSFLPPMGQFKNGSPVKGWVLLAGEAVALAVAAPSYVLYKKWERGDGIFCPVGEPHCERQDTAKTLRTVNIGAGAAFLAIYAYGVIDSLMERSQPRTEEQLLRAAPPAVSVSLLPNGAALNVLF